MKIGKNKRDREDSQIYEFVFVPVPKDKKRSTSGLFLINMGYVTAFSCYLIGVKIGYVMPFWKAVAACVLGNAFLIIIAVFMGIAARRTGLSTSFLARKILGKQGSMILSVFIIFLSISWISMNGDAFAKYVIAAFSHFPLPIPVTAVLIISIWSFSASRGMKGIGMISYITVPIIAAITIVGIFILGRETDGFEFINTYRPSVQISFAAGVSMIIGNFIFGCTISPDIFRFAESDKAVYMGIFSYLFGLLPPNICGILIAQAVNTSDFTVGVTKLGLVIPFFICILLCLWTTEDNNAYSASLAVQNLFYRTPLEGNLSHKTITYIICGLAAAFASLGAIQYLIPIIAFLSCSVPPIAGIILCEYYVLKPEKRNKGCGMAAWIISSTAGYISFKYNFFIPPFAAFMTSFFVYMMLRRLEQIKNKK